MGLFDLFVPFVAYMYVMYNVQSRICRNAPAERPKEDVSQGLVYVFYSYLKTQNHFACAQRANTPQPLPKAEERI